MTDTTASAPLPLTLTPGKAAGLRWVGILAITAGILMVITGAVVWGVVTTQLRAEKITVAEDAAFLAGAEVAGPFSALAQADIINVHALKITDNQTYAELGKDDPLRAVVMNASFLRTSLFTSVVSYGVSAFAIGSGLILGLVGWALTALSPKAAPRRASV
ncbi:hypothetical protein GCM10022198_25750 [Klugiella xanthotipulae]|uniref:Aromatic ring-opening dioxygenase LigA n=1 Tax=Klugiella xanthotipulae TaxID=244735 RepID=A0A543I5S0_9MICO|nr:aromatic ring-opening dioxygenase LigA [Klugiella xanthotipulae]TQM65891.1 hypothetical protein FB466_0711 [Klugiella xanthotipulae]